MNNIRRAVVDDLPAMLQVMDEALGEPFIEEELSDRLLNWRPRFASPDFVFHVIEASGNQIIAWARGGKVIPVHKEADGVFYEYEIHNMFVKKQYQGAGVGRALWDAVWKDVMEKYQPQNLIVWSVESARGFYSKLGLAESETKSFSDQHYHTAYVWHK